MIKVIAFDLVGVLVNEKDIDLSEVEDKLERMFGPNLNDADYLIEARKIIEKDSIIMNITETLIDKLYKVKDKEIFKKVKEKNKNVKIIIATNHLSFVRNFIGESFNVEYSPKNRVHFLYCLCFKFNVINTNKTNILLPMSMFFNVSIHTFTCI